MVRFDYPFRNLLLSSFEPDDLYALAVHLHQLKLPVNLSFESPGQAIDQVCFPEHGIVSVVAQSGRQHIEVGLVGYEGVTGGAVVMGDGHAVNDVSVQVAGDGHWISADDLRRVIHRRPSLLSPLLRYFHVFGIQAAHSALANGRFCIDERLSRWLLMAQDRMQSEELHVTHQSLAAVLGVRRPGVTDASHRLEGDHLITGRRGVVVIRNREGLKARADGSYGVPEEEYMRLCGSSLSKSVARFSSRPFAAATATLIA